MDWGYIISVMLTGLIVVFVALLLLIFIISIFGAISSRALKEKSATNESDKVQKKNICEAAPENDESEIVAVITAAITAVRESNGETSQFKIKSVKRSGASRPVWGLAGIYENTKPF